MSSRNRVRTLHGHAQERRERFSATARRRRQRLRTVFGDCQGAPTTPANGFRQVPEGAGNACERFSATARGRRQRLRTVFGKCQEAPTTPANGFRRLPGGAGNACERFSATARRRRQRLRTVFGNCQEAAATGVHGAQPTKTKGLGIRVDLRTKKIRESRRQAGESAPSTSISECCRAARQRMEDTPPRASRRRLQCGARVVPRREENGMHPRGWIVTGPPEPGSRRKRAPASARRPRRPPARRPPDT